MGAKAVDVLERDLDSMNWTLSSEAAQPSLVELSSEAGGENRLQGLAAGQGALAEKDLAEAAEPTLRLPLLPS